jgi:hypothetical protein
MRGGQNVRLVFLLANYGWFPAKKLLAGGGYFCIVSPQHFNFTKWNHKLTSHLSVWP